MKIRIFIGYNNGLPNVDRSLKVILDKIAQSGIADAELTIVRASADKFEYPTLEVLWQACQEDEFYGLYLHCKGGSKSEELDYLNGLAWLNYMLYGLLDNHESCIQHMSLGADLVGCMWYRHFKGNCFWFNSKYIKKLISPDKCDKRNRYMAEFWCSQAYWWNSSVSPPRVKNMFYIPLNSDNDFLKHSEQGYVPDVKNKNKCEDFPKLCASNRDLSVFDEIVISSSDYELYKSQIHKYVNYDSILTIINLV